MRFSFFPVAIIVCLSCTSESNVEVYSKSWSDEDRNYLIANLESSIQGILINVRELDDTQWHWKSDSSSWSIAMIIEHLITHDELFYRELQIVNGLPQMPPLQEENFASDESILSYREITDQNTGSAPAYLEPLGRWCSKPDALNAYTRVRKAMINLVKSTDKDLRKYYTRSGRGPTQYRDIHQLLLISIAHTERHHKQIVGILSR